MAVPGMIEGFSKLDRDSRIRLVAALSDESAGTEAVFSSHLLEDSERQHAYHEISENAVSNYILPLGIAPNFNINGKYYLVPMVTEESSVVAAAAAAAKFWATRGGFVTRVQQMIKPGHIHFIWQGSESELTVFFTGIKPALEEAVKPLTRNMELRGGGIHRISLIDLSARLPGYHQIEVLFGTADSMGANFINSCLEAMAAELVARAAPTFPGRLEVIMAILSNHTPDCLVSCQVSARVEEFALAASGLSGADFARRFVLAVEMARVEPSRAVTHNKGIYNGVDAVVLATGNDFRATEAAGHAWAARDGVYRGLSRAWTEDGALHLMLEIPLALGTVGGLTRTHPMAAAALKVLGNPGAATLMGIAAAAGLANNYSAVKALVTGGIQQGHMRLHLPNLLRQWQATPDEMAAAAEYFMNKPVSYQAVGSFLNTLRTTKAYKP